MSMQDDYNRVINHAITLGISADAFLSAWMVGDWDTCRTEFDFEVGVLADPTYKIDHWSEYELYVEGVLWSGYASHHVYAITKERALYPWFDQGLAKRLAGDFELVDYFEIREAMITRERVVIKLGGVK